LGDGLFESFFGIIDIEDRVVVFESNEVAVVSEEPSAVAVECPHPDGVIADDFLDPMLHLFGGFVGERQGQNRIGRDSLLEKVGDAVGHDTCFSGPRSGQGQQRAFDVCDGLVLRFVQSIQDLIHAVTKPPAVIQSGPKGPGRYRRDILCIIR